MNPLGNKKVLHLMMGGVLANALSACAGHDNQKVPSKAPLNYDTSVCGSEDSLDLLTDLQANQNFDSVSLYHPGIQVHYTELAGGEPCSNAINKGQCEEMLTSEVNDLFSRAVIVTQGDQVVVYQSPEELSNVLEYIDNEKKVFLWLHINGMSAECENGASSISRVPDEPIWQAWYEEYTSICAPITVDRVTVQIDFDGTITELSREEISHLDGACIGRRPPGFFAIKSSYHHQCNHVLGRMFAKHAAFEAASVIAFNHLKSELEYHGAPESLLEEIAMAAQDEVRHAEQVSELAGCYGAEMVEFEVEPGDIRDLKTIALDNLKEGCIGETWGALIGLFQAQNAQTAQIRETMLAIAEDEIGHAALSWKIHDWLYGKFDSEIKEEIDRFKVDLMGQLEERTRRVTVEEFQLVAGLPTPVMQQALFEHFRESVLDT